MQEADDKTFRCGLIKMTEVAGVRNALQTIKYTFHSLKLHKVTDVFPHL